MSSYMSLEFEAEFISRHHLNSVQCLLSTPLLSRYLLFINFDPSHLRPASKDFTSFIPPLPPPLPPPLFPHLLRLAVWRSSLPRAIDGFCLLLSRSCQWIICVTVHELLMNSICYCPQNVDGLCLSLVDGLYLLLSRSCLWILSVKDCVWISVKGWPISTGKMKSCGPN